ncbi:unnamed protein product [Effrenium voratum]|nr:unnamed protein product [Effrenium voratum]
MLHGIYDEQARLTPSAPAVVAYRPGGRSELTYAGLQERSTLLAESLSRWRDRLDGVIAAVWLPRTHEDFLPVLLALSRCGVCFALMSTDLKDKDLERQRNRQIVEVLQPSFLVLPDGGLPDPELEGVTENCAKMTPSSAGFAHQGPGNAAGSAGKPLSGALCLLFTGGTFRSRCVVVTHQMVQHERVHYSEVVAVKGLRMACHTSVYWGASALGQLSIALALAGTAILCEVQETEDFRRVISEEKVNGIGLVPDQLKLLAEDPQVELPDLKAVFVWGEKLPLTVAQRWRNHPARLLELLVSTEYWLSFYSAPLEGSGHRVVGGVELLIVDGQNQALASGVGELLLRGDMVTPGYFGSESQEESFVELEGRRYFRTRDLVQRKEDGTLEFRGRADMSMKQGGQWVDLGAKLSALEALSGVEDAALLPDPGGGSRMHGFLVLKSSLPAEVAAVTLEAKRLLPQATIHLLSSLPRHPVTRKVDVGKLTKLAQPAEESWPYGSSVPAPFTEQRATQKVWDSWRWTSAALLAARAYGWRDQGVKAYLGLLLLPYMHLAYLHIAESVSQPWRLWSALLHGMPMGAWGAMLLALLSRPMTSLDLASAWAAAGAALAVRRGRLLSFPLIFWWGAGHRLQYELERWCTWRYWCWYLTSWPELFASSDKEQPRREAKKVEPQKEEVAEHQCRWCSRPMAQEWPPPLLVSRSVPLQDPEAVFGCNDGEGRPLCWACWVLESESAARHARGLADRVLAEQREVVVEADDEKKQEASWATDGTVWQEDWKRRYDKWWWANKTVDLVELPPPEPTARAADLGGSEGRDPRLRKLRKCLEDVLRMEVSDDMSFRGLDSLSLGLLAGRLRTEFGATLSITQLRNGSPKELLELLQAGVLESSQNGTTDITGSEYAIWFSPGQFFPMGGWVLRHDDDVSLDRFRQAASQVVRRHRSLCAVPADPLRLLSFVLDSAVMFTLSARLLDRHGLRFLRRVLSWAFKSCWPRVKVKDPEVYKELPVEIIVEDQPSAEWHCKDRRKLLAESGNGVDIALIQIRTQLEGLWVYGLTGGMGDFVIYRDEERENRFVLVDRARHEVAVLHGPADDEWIPPPYGFPALLSARVRPTGVLWLRIKSSRHLTVLWKSSRSATQYRRFDAFRMPGSHVNSVFSYLVVHAMHTIADGGSFEAVVGDLLALYTAFEDPRMAPPPVAHNSLALLQRRLFDALDAADPKAAPQLTSLRGSQWRCQKRGYGHLLGFRQSVLGALRCAALRHLVPFDAALLALTAIMVARGTDVEEVEFTLYVPLRDGPGEANLCGLFADWREIQIRIDRESSTVLGVVHQVADKIRLRQWAVYNPLKKPETFVVNFQLMTEHSRNGFVQIGEELWRIGECMREEQRDDKLPWAPQPLSFVIEQGDKETWWLLINCAYDDYPPPVLRRMLKAFQDAAEAFVLKPTAKAHLPYPNTFY